MNINQLMKEIEVELNNQLQKIVHEPQEYRYQVYDDISFLLRQKINNAGYIMKDYSRGEGGKKREIIFEIQVAKNIRVSRTIYFNFYTTTVKPKHNWQSNKFIPKRVEFIPSDMLNEDIEDIIQDRLFEIKMREKELYARLTNSTINLKALLTDMLNKVHNNQQIETSNMELLNLIRLHNDNMKRGDK